MSSQFTPQQIAQQNAVFQQALANKQITQQLYNDAMKVQSANLTAYNAAHQTQTVILPADFVGPPAPNQIQTPTTPTNSTTQTTPNISLPQNPQTILNERAVFESAYQSGQINDAEYNQAMQFNQQQLTNIGYNVTSISEPVPRPTSDFVGPMPTRISKFEATQISTPQQQTQSQQANPNSPLSQGALGKNPDIFKNTGAFGITPVINTKEKATIALKIVSAVTLFPIVGPAVAVKGALINVGISEGMRFLPSNPITGDYRGNFGSPQELVGEAAEGVIFAGIGKAVLGVGENIAQAGFKRSVLEGFQSKAVIQGAPSVASQLAGRAVWTAPGRVTIFTGVGAVLGGGSEYISTGQVTPRGVATGALFGLGFSVAGEVISRGMPTIQNKAGVAKEGIQNKIINSNLERLSNIDEHYQKSYMNYEKFKPSLAEKLTMKSTGLEPYKPSKGSVSLPNIPTGKMGPSESSLGTLKAKTLEVSNMADPGTTLEGKSVQSQYYPTNLNKGFKVVSSTSFINNKNTDDQLNNLEQLSKQPLPRTENDVIETKINNLNFDSKTTSAKIDAQLKQSQEFFDKNQAETNMNKALREAQQEKMNNAKNNLSNGLKQQGDFITGLEKNKGYPAKATSDYLIKQPQQSNLNISEQTNIHSRNTFDPIQAKNRMNSLLNEVPSRSNYDDYNKIMSQGRTMTATKTRQGNNQLFNLEQMTKQPLPRNTDYQTNNILPNSVSTKTSPIFISSKTESTRLTPRVNVNRNYQTVTQKMDTQFSGVDSYTKNLINNRIFSSNKESAKTNIAEAQTSGIRSTIGLGQSSALQGIGVGNQFIGNKIATATGQGQQQAPTLKTIIGQQQSQQVTPTLKPPTTITAQTQQPFIDSGRQKQTTGLGLPPFGSKAMEFGGNSGGYPNFTGLRSTKRQYDILTAEEFLGY